MTAAPPVRFSVPTLIGPEPQAVADAIVSGHVASGGPHTQQAEALIAARVGRSALFTSSCTDALLLAVMALDLGEGDEVVVPGFTFVSTALVVAVRGATPVFADIDERTLTLSPRSLEQHLTARTRAVITVHYGGDPGELQSLRELTSARGIVLIEDAAHAYGGRYRGRALGSIGDLGTLSFDHQKNLQCGEGGALLVDDPELRARARVLREKGTNRQAFLDGEVDKYTWVGLGGHHLPPDYVAAGLIPQLHDLAAIQQRRAAAWRRYANSLRQWAGDQGIVLAGESPDVDHSHHIFWMLLPTPEHRRSFTAWMAAAGITAPFHYPSLAHTPAGRRYGRTDGTPVSDSVAGRLVRLPLHHALSETDLDRVIERAIAWRPIDEEQ